MPKTKSEEKEKIRYVPSHPKCVNCGKDAHEGYLVNVFSIKEGKACSQKCRNEYFEKKNAPVGAGAGLGNEARNQDVIKAKDTAFPDRRTGITGEKLATLETTVEPPCGHNAKPPETPAPTSSLTPFQEDLVFCIKLMNMVISQTGISDRLKIQTFVLHKLEQVEQRGRDAKYKELQPLLESLGKGIIQTCESANIAVEKAKNAPRTYSDEDVADKISTELISKFCPIILLCNKETQDMTKNQFVAYVKRVLLPLIPLKSEADVKDKAVKEFCERLGQMFDGLDEKKTDGFTRTWTLNGIRKAIKEAHTCPAGQDADKS